MPSHLFDSIIGNSAVGGVAAPAIGTTIVSINVLAGFTYDIEINGTTFNDVGNRLSLYDGATLIAYLADAGSGGANNVSWTYSLTRHTNANGTYIVKAGPIAGGGAGSAYYATLTASPLRGDMQQ